MRALHGRRIEACISLLSEILRGEVRNREEAVRRLEEIYNSSGLEPIRGWTKINIFDKEMCTAYLVAKYGLGLDPGEYERLYKRYFYIETGAERAAERIRAGEDPAKVIREELGEVNENLVFRVARLEATAALLGFKSEEGLAELLRRLEEAFPELKRKINGFRKFYIAFRVAQEIVAGNIRNRLEKEAFKHALCIKLNAEKAAPSDEFVREIAVNVLKARESYVNNALSLKGIEAKIAEGEED